MAPTVASHPLLDTQRSATAPPPGPRTEMAPTIAAHPLVDAEHSPTAPPPGEKTAPAPTIAVEAQPEGRILLSLMEAQRLRVTAGHGARIVVRGVRVEHAVALKALLKGQVRADGWVLVGMRSLTTVARIDKLLTLAIHGHIPLLRANLHQLVYLDSFRHCCRQIRLAVEGMYGKLPRLQVVQDLGDAGVMVLVQQVTDTASDVYYYSKNGKRSDRWLYNKLKAIKSDMIALRCGTAYLPADDAPAVDAAGPVDAPPDSSYGPPPSTPTRPPSTPLAPSTCPPDSDSEASPLQDDAPALDALAEVFGKQKVEPVVKDEMPEVAKPSAVESP